MKTFQEFVLECYSIQETSLTRVMSKSQKGGMAIMSAQRGDKSSSENKARSKQLERDIRGVPVFLDLQKLLVDIRKIRGLQKKKK